jgi:predicted transcriptional regulator of viral defense system
LLAVASQAGNGAVWKRFGYIVEALWPDETKFVDEAQAHLAAGNVKLDPTVRRRGPLLSSWRLWVNLPLE